MLTARAMFFLLRCFGCKRVIICRISWDLLVCGENSADSFGMSARHCLGNSNIKKVWKKTTFIIFSSPPLYCTFLHHRLWQAACHKHEQYLDDLWCQGEKQTPSRKVVRQQNSVRYQRVVTLFFLENSCAFAFKNIRWSTTCNALNFSHNNTFPTSKNMEFHTIV